MLCAHTHTHTHIVRSLTFSKAINGMEEFCDEMLHPSGMDETKDEIKNGVIRIISAFNKS